MPLYVVVLWHVLSGALCVAPPHVHPNVSSGDLLDYSDYSDPITPVAVKLPPYLKHDQKGNVIAFFTLHYGDEEKVVAATKDDLLVMKKQDPTANMKEIWHIQKEDLELKQFFAKVLDLSPDDVNVVHIAFSKTESVKKILVLEKIMSATDLLAKLIAAEGKTF